MSEKQPQETGHVEIKHSFEDLFDGGKSVQVSYRLKRPTPQQVARVQKTILKDSSMAMRNLCLDLVHEDDRAAMQSDFDKYPGLPATIGGAVLKSVGFGDLGN